MSKAQEIIKQIKVEEMESPVAEWNDKNRIPRGVVDMVNSVPEKSGEEFYVKWDKGVKHYIPANKENKLVQWLKLTDELFE